MEDHNLIFHHKRHKKMKTLLEKITASTPTGEVIRDFIKSKAPQFKGKSKKERIRMALGAKYAMMRNEEHSIKIPLTKEEVNFIHSMIAEGKVKKQNKTMKNWVIKTAMTQGMSPRPRGSEATRIARKKYSEMKENRIFISLSEAGPVKRENKAKAREYMRGLGQELSSRLNLRRTSSDEDIKSGRSIHRGNMGRMGDRLSKRISQRRPIEPFIKSDWAERKIRLDSYGKNPPAALMRHAVSQLPAHLQKIGATSMYGSRYENVLHKFSTLISEEEHDIHKDFRAGGMTQDEYHQALDDYRRNHPHEYEGHPGSGLGGWRGSSRRPRSAPEVKHPHAIHIDGKKWKTFSSHSHASNVARKILQRNKKAKIEIVKE